MWKLVFVLFFLFVAENCCLAQLQGQISASAERKTYLSVSDVNTIKVESCGSDIISLCQYANGTYIFTRTDSSNNVVRIVNTTLPDTILNFRVFDDRYIFFCGMHNGRGFVASSSTDIFFNNSYGFKYTDLYDIEQVFDLEVFKGSNGVEVVALGAKSGTCFLIDFPNWYNYMTTFNAYKTINKLHCITQTKGFIAVIYTSPIPTSYFGVARHDKNNISLYQDKIYKYAYNGQIALYPGALSYIADGYIRSDNIYVATTVKNQTTPNFTFPSRSISFFSIDLAQNLTLLSNQIIPTNGKPYIKDMVYSPVFDYVYLLANVSLDTIFNGVPIGTNYGRVDAIYDIYVPASAPIYFCNVTVPNNSTPMYDRLNNMATYDNNYYIVAGVDSSNRLYWFDKKYGNYTSSCEFECYADVYFDPHNEVVGDVDYSPDILNGDIVQGLFMSTTNSYSIHCSN